MTADEFDLSIDLDHFEALLWHGAIWGVQVTPAIDVALSKLGAVTEIQGQRDYAQELPNSAREIKWAVQRSILWAYRLIIVEEKQKSLEQGLVEYNMMDTFKTTSVPVAKEALPKYPIWRELQELSAVLGLRLYPFAKNEATAEWLQFRWTRTKQGSTARASSVRRGAGLGLAEALSE